MSTRTQDLYHDTIVAPATPPGRGSVSIVRVSGSASTDIMEKVTGTRVRPRVARYLPFLDEKRRIIDKGIVLYFSGPDSFTGEDVLELHGHGGPVVNDMLVRAINRMGVRLARPGEFSERAFLNDKIDLSQAEAIADLIDSSSEQAARSAMRSLQGVFSEKVHNLTKQVTELRVYVEAAIDFSEEEIDFLMEGNIVEKLDIIERQIDSVINEAQQGALLQQGMTVVIAGKPNAGKSSLLNALSGKDAAIVTEVAGTTRDILRENINIDGMPLHVIDTAGLRDSEDRVEKIGVERALKEIKNADLVLLVTDSYQDSRSDPVSVWNELLTDIPVNKCVTLVKNKIDLTGEPAGITENKQNTVLCVCAQTGEGIDTLKTHLKTRMGFSGANENGFSARRRHVEALKEAHRFVSQGKYELLRTSAGELLAEDLRMAQKALSEITGEFSSDDLLGHIFSSFCIGK